MRHFENPFRHAWSSQPVKANDILLYLPLLTPSSPDLVSGGKDSKSLIIGAIFQTRARVGRWYVLTEIMPVAMPEAEISI